MKKFLLSLAVLFAGMATAQTYYSAGEAVTEVAENEPFLLSCDAAGTRFFTNDGKHFLTSDLPTGDALVEFEFANEDEDGTIFYFIKFSESGMYVADQEMRDGMDSSDMANWILPYITLTDDPEKAAKWTVMPAATRTQAEAGADGYIANWRVWTGQGDGDVPFENAMVIMRDALSTANPSEGTAGGKNPVYLEVQGDYSFFALWGVNSWFISYPEEMDEDALLYYWVDANYPDGVDGLFETSVGDRIGMYDPASIEGLKTAFEAFYAYDESGDGDPAEILAALIAGMEALKVNEMKEGYYYLVVKRANAGVIDDGGVMRGEEGFEIPRKEDGSIDLTLEASRYLWYFSVVPGKDNYLVKNFGTGKYVKISGHNDAAGIPTGDLADAVPYNVEYSESFPGTVVFKHYNANGERDCSWNYFQGNGKKIGNWYPEDDGNSFFLYGVDESLVDAIKDEVAQYELNSRLQAVYDDASSNYNKGRAYAPEAACTMDDDFSNRGYIFGKTETVTEDTVQVEKFVSNVTMVDNAGEDCIMHTGDGAGLPGLFDGDFTNHFHSKWSGTSFPQFFEIDLGAGNELEGVAVKFMRRVNSDDHNGSFTSGEMIVFGRNSLEEEWVRCSNMAITYNIPQRERDAEGNIVIDEETGAEKVKKAKAVGVGSAGLGAKYRYIRLQHYKTSHPQINGAAARENTYFSATEMALYAATYDASKSLNTVVPANILAALEAQMDAAKAQLAAGKATEAQITALQKALDEYLKNFPEPQRLVDAVAAAEVIAANLPTGGDDEVGFYPEAAADEYAEIVEGVKATVKDVMTLDEINAGVATLDAAKAALLKTLVMPASGFYQIRVDAANYKEAILHVGRTAADTKEQKGLRADFSKLVMEVTEGDTAYVDNANYSQSVSSIWYIKVGENNKLSIRSLGNGLYLQPRYANGGSIQLTEAEAELELQADGLVNGEQYNFIVGTDSVSGKTLYFNINSTASSAVGNLVSWNSAGGHDNSTFRLEPVDLADFTYGANYFAVTAGKNQFMTFPYDAKFYAQKSKVYEAVGYYEGEEEKAIYFTSVATGSTLKAGTPYLIKPEAGVNYFKTEFEQKTVSESDFVYSYEPQSVNGLTSTIFSAEIGPKFGIIGFTGDIVATANTVNGQGEESLTTIEPYSAYVDGRTLPVLDEVPAGDVLKILTDLSIDQLNAIDAVEVVETAKSGVYTISGVRLNSAKNLPAGIYVINGKKVVK